MSGAEGPPQGDVSLVIPGRNAASTLEACLGSVVPLLREPGSALREILFVDDGSRDASAEIAASYPVTLLRGAGRGPGAARNVGWRGARSPLVWFVDADCVAEPEALGWLLPHLEDPRVAGAGGSYTNLRGDSLLATVVHEEIVARHRRMGTRVDFLGSFNVLYRRSALEQVGGFDERWVNGPGRPGAEDVDLAYGLRALGHHIHFEPRSRVGHHHPTRLRSYLRSQAIHGYWRVNLHLRNPGTHTGDAYSSILDHGQPLVALLVLGLLPALAVAPARPAALALGALLCVLLVLMPVPMAWRMVAATGDGRLAAHVPLGVLRAFARGLGLLVGVLNLLRARPERRSLGAGLREPR